MTDRAKILVVDDLQEKLLVYQSVLDEPGLEILTARSGASALRQVLDHDFAVILLDINMPDIDGFETASLIRSRKRSAHTPIIFITAFADELHAIKSYSYGAVDYILSPIVPDVLRTKVRVFVDLFRKTQEIQRQAEALREVQAREHRRQLWETTERLRLALEAGQMGAFEWDLEGRLINWSPMLEVIFGFAPGEFTGDAEKLRARLHPEDRDGFLASLAAAAREEREFCIEHRIMVPRSSEPFSIGGTDERNTDAAERWVEVRGRVFRNDGGQSSRVAGVCMDITSRKQIETRLAEQRAQLKKELEESYKRLRLADRLASIGTLAAGLGHDMGNLLLPVRMRLDTLQRMTLPAEALADVKAIQTATEYLKRLSQGLRLFALDPDESGLTDDCVSLTSWWPDVEPFLRNALPRHVALESQVSADLPAVAMPAHRLTQVIYNLVQNAGDAMRHQDSGVVRIAAETVDGGEQLNICVTDTGPGMNEEVKQRCMDPFFSTKTRGISTGLGLALVRGAVLGCGGRIEIDSAIGQGTTFRLVLPARAPAPHRLTGLAPPGLSWQIQPPAARVKLTDARLKAYVTALLRSQRLQVLGDASDDNDENDAGLLVIDGSHRFAQRPECFLDSSPGRRLIIVAPPPASVRDEPQISFLPANTSPAKWRQALHDACYRPIPEKITS